MADQVLSKTVTVMRKIKNAKFQGWDESGTSQDICAQDSVASRQAKPRAT